MKIIFTVIIVLIVVVGIFYSPKRISLGGGMVPNQSYQTCDGFYLETYNDTPLDGDRGGWCFGKVINHS